MELSLKEPIFEPITHLLQLSSAAQKIFVNSALDCILILDHHNRIIEFNPAAESTFGYTRDFVMGKSILELLIPLEKRSGSIRSYLQLDNHLAPSTPFNTTALRSDGTEFHVQVTVQVVLINEQPICLLHLRDLTTHQQTLKAYQHAVLRRKR